MAKSARDEVLLQALTAADRQTIEAVLQTYPDLTAAEAIEMSAEMGGVSLTCAEAKALPFPAK